VALIDFQTVMGRMLREQKSDTHLRGVSLDERESRYFEKLRETTEFRFYASVQRSWCIARAAKSASLTLSLLPPEKRELLLDEWVDSGAGASSFHGVESELFLDFISRHLPDPSHELTVCQFERATLRANNEASHFVAPDVSGLQDSECIVRRGSYAELVRFYTDLDHLSSAVQNHEPLPEKPIMLVLFGPGLPRLCTEPSHEEVSIWEALSTPASVRTLLDQHHSLTTLQELLSHGAIELQQTSFSS
jgi:hypothetical protein